MHRSRPLATHPAMPIAEEGASNQRTAILASPPSPLKRFRATGTIMSRCSLICLYGKEAEA
jgi:hypothetical protein